MNQCVIFGIISSKYVSFIEIYMPYLGFIILFFRIHTLYVILVFQLLIWSKLIKLSRISNNLHKNFDVFE